MTTTRPSTIEVSSYLNSLIATGRTGGSRAASRRTAMQSRAESRARAVSAGAGGTARVICGISEGRGAATVVGLCFIVVATNECVLCNIADSQTYIRTLQKMDVFDPTEIVVPCTAVSATPPPKTAESKLVGLIRQYFGTARLVPVPRKQYHAQTGIDLLVKWAGPGEAETVAYELGSKYFTACAAAAAIQYTQSKHLVDYTTRSLRIKFQPCEDSMALNSTTIKALELVHNSIDLKRGMSLFKLMNHTQTAMGARMLRSSILQPLTSESTLTRRHNAVEELCKSELCCSELAKSRLFFSAKKNFSNTKYRA